MTNEEKYKTTEERAAAFRRYCDRYMGKFNGCATGNCPLRTPSLRACQFAWLALEAEEEMPLACPFCGGEAKTVLLGVKEFAVHCYGCSVETDAYTTEADAIAAWNRRAK